MIDKCSYSFKKLADEVPPNKMKRLREDMKKPRPLARFAEHGVGPKTILKELGKAKDFSACYVIFNEDPLYVGISRKLVQRLRNQVHGKNHLAASLAHMMAVKNSGYNGSRKEAMDDPDYKRAFEQAKSVLTRSSFAFVEIENPVELYLFEVYAAMELKTCVWNTFVTH